MHIEIENGSFIFFAPYFLHPEYSTAVITNVRWDFCRNRNTDECNAAAVLLTGDFPSAIETLVTAVSLIRQSKIADSDPCKTLISSLQDTLQGLEQKSYETKLVFRFLQKHSCQHLKKKSRNDLRGAWHAAHGQGWVSSFCELFAKLIVATISDLS